MMIKWREMLGREAAATARCKILDYQVAVRGGEGKDYQAVCKYFLEAVGGGVVMVV